MKTTSDKFTILGCRIVLMTYCLMHGLRKFGLFSSTQIGDFADYLGAVGVAAPRLAAYVLAGGLLISGLLLAIGTFHKAACVFILVYMCGNIWYVTGSSYFGATGFEYAAALCALASLFFLQGPGPFAYKFQFRRQEDGPPRY